MTTPPPASRVAALALCAAAAAAAAGFGLAPASAQNSNQRPPTNTAPKPKKKLPPGVRGFEQFANRDASDKLVAGGATRGDCKTRTALEALECGTGRLTDLTPDYAGAVEALSKAAALDPNMFAARYRLALAYEALGRYREAAESYKLAVALKPNKEVGDTEHDPLFAQYNLANSHALAGQHREAAEAYRRLIATAPEPLAKPHYNLGLSLVALGDQAGAAEAFKKAVEIMPDFAEAHFNLGVLHSRAEQYPEAVAAFQQALRLKSDHQEARYYLGLAYYLTDNRAGLLEQQKALQDAKSKYAADLARLAGR